MTILNELLVALLGHPGDIFEKKNNYKAATEFPYIHPSERLALDRVSILGSQYEIMRNFVDNNKYNGLYMSIFAMSIDRIMEDYEREIVELESCLESTTPVLGEVTLKLQSYFVVFETIIQVINDFQGGNIGGIGVLNHLRRKRKSIATPTLETIMQR